MFWPEWPEAAKALEVIVALGAGLGGPEKGEDVLWSWLVLLWWLEDWPPPRVPHASLVPGIGAP